MEMMEREFGDLRLNTDYLNEMFSCMDADRSGNVTLSEFTGYMLANAPRDMVSKLSEEIAPAWAAAASNGAGNLRAMRSALGTAFSQPSPPPPRPDAEEPWWAQPSMKRGELLAPPLRRPERRGALRTPAADLAGLGLAAAGALPEQPPPLGPLPAEERPMWQRRLPLPTKSREATRAAGSSPLPGPAASVAGLGLPPGDPPPTAPPDLHRGATEGPRDGAPVGRHSGVPPDSPLAPARPCGGPHPEPPVDMPCAIHFDLHPEPAGHLDGDSEVSVLSDADVSTAIWDAGPVERDREVFPEPAVPLSGVPGDPHRDVPLALPGAVHVDLHPGPVGDLQPVPVAGAPPSQWLPPLPRLEAHPTGHAAAAASTPLAQSVRPQEASPACRTLKRAVTGEDLPQLLALSPLEAARSLWAQPANQPPLPGALLAQPAGPQEAAPATRTLRLAAISENMPNLLALSPLEAARSLRAQFADQPPLPGAPSDDAPALAPRSGSGGPGVAGAPRSRSPP